MAEEMSGRSGRRCADSFLLVYAIHRACHIAASQPPLTVHGCEFGTFFDDCSEKFSFFSFVTFVPKILQIYCRLSSDIFHLFF